MAPPAKTKGRRVLYQFPWYVRKKRMKKNKGERRKKIKKVCYLRGRWRIDGGKQARTDGSFGGR